MVEKFLIIPVLIFLVSNLLPFVYWPEMLNWPFFIANGWLPYGDIAIVHTPFLLGLLTYFYKLFGFSPWTLHLFGSFLLVITAILIGLMTRKILPQIIFGLLVLSLSGNTVWFESLLAPILLLLYWALKSKKFILAGILFGLALTTKQTVAYLLPVVALPFLKQKLKVFLTFLISVFIPLALFVIWLVNSGLFTDFWRWGVQFVFLKTSVTAGEHSYVLWPTIKQFALVSILIFVPLIFSRNLAFVWMLFSLLFAVPRFDYFHLVPFVAFFALTIGTAKIKKKFLIMIIIFSLIIFILFLRSSLKQDHSFLDKNTLEVTEYVKNNFSNKKVFFLNSYDQIYFLTKKMPVVKPWLPQLPWYFKFYGEEFLSDLKRAKPEVIIITPYLEKSVDGLGAYRPKGVLEYLEQNYMMIYSFSGGTKVYQHL